MKKSYSELITLNTFEERYQYLKLNGKVGEDTFGTERYLNQKFYKDPEWLETRDLVIIRDNGCDLGCTDRVIPDGVHILVHHINPVTKEQILYRDRTLFDPDNLICTIKQTHDAIHYGDSNLLMKEPVTRSPNDTCPWRK